MANEIQPTICGQYKFKNINIYAHSEFINNSSNQKEGAHHISDV